ncbi:MAG: YraN family protein [Gammaproteobacteria bacterium]|nr:YraN family protein [Gammaproteobacteria bacterium]
MSYLPKRRGDRAETVALKFLQTHGLHPVARNYRCRWGEIDLIMRDSGTLVFIEVRYRSGQQFGGAAMSIAPQKQLRLRRSAQYYLCTVVRDMQTICRFDVVALDSRHMDIDWIKDAFSPGCEALFHNDRKTR